MIYLCNDIFIYVTMMGKQFEPCCVCQVSVEDKMRWSF